MGGLVNMSAVGYDLVRLPGGAAAARVLDLAVALGEDDLDRLASGVVPRAVEPHVPAQRGSSEHLPLALRRSADLVGEGRPEEALALLEGVPVLGPEVVVDLVREELLDWVGRLPVDHLSSGLRATAVLRDAVIACWAGHVDDPAVAHVLAYADARAGGPGAAGAVPGLAEAPGGAAVLTLLDTVADLDRAGVLELLDATGAARPAGWAQAMHAATWAAHVTDRLRLAARAQLQAVVAVRRAPFTTTELASGGWNAVSGAALALLLADVLDEDSVALLTAPVAHLL